MIDAPPIIQSYLKGQDVAHDTIGQTDSQRYRIGDQYFLKVQRVGADEPFAEIEQISTWLGQYVPVPRVIQLARQNGKEYLLTTCLSGQPACEKWDDPRAIVDAYADALRRFHTAVPVSSCPFDQRLDRKIKNAEMRLQAGTVDEQDFDAARQGWSASAVLREVHETRPSREDLVVTHGDYCLPNVMLDGQLALTGYVDLGRCGVADRYQDLALAARSIAFNMGDAWVPRFFERYGIAPEPRLVDFYQLLDELF